MANEYLCELFFQGAVQLNNNDWIENRYAANGRSREDVYIFDEQMKWMSSKPKEDREMVLDLMKKHNETTDGKKFDIDKISKALKEEKND